MGEEELDDDQLYVANPESLPEVDIRPYKNLTEQMRYYDELKRKAFMKRYYARMDAAAPFVASALAFPFLVAGGAELASLIGMGAGTASATSGAGAYLTPAFTNAMRFSPAVASASTGAGTAVATTTAPVSLESLLGTLGVAGAGYGSYTRTTPISVRYADYDTAPADDEDDKDDESETTGSTGTGTGTDTGGTGTGTDTGGTQTPKGGSNNPPNGNNEKKPGLLRRWFGGNKNKDSGERSPFYTLLWETKGHNWGPWYPARNLGRIYGIYESYPWIPYLWGKHWLPQPPTGNTETTTPAAGTTGNGGGTPAATGNADTTHFGNRKLGIDIDSIANEMGDLQVVYDDFWDSK